MPTQPIQPTAEKPQQVAAIEIDGSKCYLLDQTLDIGPDYENLAKQRANWEKEYTLDGHTLDVLKVLTKGVKMQAPTLLEGPTAASKTSAIEYLAMVSGYKYHRINLKGQSDTSEFLGKFVPNPHAKTGEAPLMWQDGLLVRAMKDGHWVILDELNLGEPQVLEALNSVLEKHPSVTLTDNGGYKVGPGGDMEVHPNFRIFATMNPGYTGRQPLSPAFQNRWTNRFSVSAPTQAQLEAMLNHHSFGEQPAVIYQGDTYQSANTETPPQMAKVRELPQPSLKALFARLAAFHEAISFAAEKQDIGRNLDPGHIFTRRDLSTFLDYISTAESFSRHKREVRNVTTHPAEIIWEAIQLVYLNKMNDSDDLAKVKTLLIASALDEAALKELFRVKDIVNETRARAKGAAGKGKRRSKPKPSLPPGELSPEVKEIQADLERDYNRSVETLKFYDKVPNPTDPTKLITAPLPHEDAEKPGTYFYKADYNGSTETIADPADATRRIPNPAAENFIGSTFTMPTFPEVLSWLTVEQVWLYNDMKAKGLEPKLQLAPIAMTIRSMGMRIDAKRAELKINTNNTYVWDGIKESELVYEADKFEAIDEGKKLKLTGGKSKSQWIKEHNGWAIDIVATRQDLDADGDKKTKTKAKTGGGVEEVELTNAEKTHMYMEICKIEGYRGLGYETYLTAQMEALRRGKPLEKNFWTILPDSSLTDQGIIARGPWRDGYVYLNGYNADVQVVGFRFRRSVRVRRLEI